MQWDGSVPVTDQAVDAGDTAVSEEEQRPAAEPAPTESQFLGRTRELKELRADIERAGLDTLAGRKTPRARVLLIAGKPGSGRTALAEELVRQVADSYPDGVLRARLTEPDGTPVATERTARDLLTALELTAPAGPARTSSPSGCARDSPLAVYCSCWTTRRTPSRSTCSSRRPPTVSSSPSRADP